MDRRAFLSIVAGTPFVFGLQELLSQDSAPAKAAAPEWYQAALKRMKATRRFGVVLIVPAEPEEQVRIGKALIQLYNAPTDPNYEVCYGVVLICLRPEMAKACFGGEAGKSNRFLLDPDGALVQEDRIATTLLEDRSKFESDFRAFAYGPDETRLKEQARIIEKGLTADQKTAGLEVLTEVPGKASLWRRTLFPIADSALPWLLEAYHAAEAKQKNPSGPTTLYQGSKTFLFLYMSGQTSSKSDLNLPFGVRFTERERSEEQGCPSCGMSSMFPARRLQFLSFFEK